MRVSCIAYENLRAEMGRKNIGIINIAEAVGCNRDTLARKLSKRSPIYLDEAFAIQQKVFPDHSVEYLFGTNETFGLDTDQQAANQ